MLLSSRYIVLPLTLLVSTVIVNVGIAASDGGKTSQQLALHSSLKKNKKFQQALKSLQQGLPLETEVLLRECMAHKSLPKEAKEVVRCLLAETLIRVGKIEEGLKLWSELPDSSLKSYWTAVGYMEQAYYTKAMQVVSTISEDDTLYDKALQLKARIAYKLKDRQLLVSNLTKLAKSSDAGMARSAKLLLADTLIDIKSFADASEMLEELKQELQASDNLSSTLIPCAALVEGKLAISQHQYDLAISVLSSQSERSASPKLLQDLAKLALAKAEIEKEKANPLQEEAETRAQESVDDDDVKPFEVSKVGTGYDRLLTFIGSNPDSPLLLDALDILTASDAFSTNPQALEKLTAWAQTKDNRQAAAIYTLGSHFLRKNDLTEAQKVCLSGIENQRQSVVVEKLCLNVISALIQKNRLDEAAELMGKYPDSQTNIIFQKAALAYQSKDYNTAASLFSDAAHHCSEPTAAAAIFNEMLSLLHAGAEEKQISLINKVQGTPQFQENLLFQQAHYAASRMSPRAVELLDSYLRIASVDEFKVQAQLDRANVALNLNPPDIAKVEELIPVIEKNELNYEHRMQVWRLKIMLAEQHQQWTTAIQHCRSAISADDKKKMSDALNLKLGELLYKNGDFHEAKIILQAFPTKFPESSLKASALFLAGKAAQQTNTATALTDSLAIFKSISTEESSFSLPAKIEEASILLRMGKADECIALLDELLKEKLPRYMRLLALSIQADAWVTKENTQSDTLQKAIALCTEILETPNLGMVWKFKALSQRAQFYERTNELQKALDDYASILAHTPQGVAANKRRDWHWFYHAGFSSIRIFGQLQRWNEAYALANKLAQTSGPRAREAADYVRRIKLEHFVWDEDKKSPITEPTENK